MKIDVFDEIGKAYQRSLDKKEAKINKQIDLTTVTDDMTAKMMAITIRDWTDGLLVFDDVILDVDDIRKIDEADKEVLVDMINKYWKISNLRDSCDFIKSNVMVLQKIIANNHTIMTNLDEEQDWKAYLDNQVKREKIAICGFITHRYDKYTDE